MSDLDITYDAIIIGGGHNGLVAAAYLAKERLKVLVIEARDLAGGMAATEEIWPGYHVNRVAHVYTGLHTRIIRDLRLHRHGLKLSARHMPTLALGDDDEVVTFSPDKRHGRTPALGLSPADAESYQRFTRNMGALSALAASLGTQQTRDHADTERLLRQTLKRLDEEAAADFAALALSSPGDLLSRYFESPLVQGALCVDALLGGTGGPFDGGAMGAWAWRLAGEVSGTRMAYGHPKGGMGAVTEALLSALGEAGGSVLTGTKVARILTEDGRAYGIETDGRLRFGARAIVSAFSPRDTILRLVGEENVEIDTASTLKALSHEGAVARLTLALSGLPTFKGIDDPTRLEGRIVIAPSLHKLGDAWDEARRGEPANHPAFEITIPTTHDPELSPGAKHILCANVLFAPYRVNGGWAEGKDKYLKRVIDALNYYAPGIRELVLHAELLTPADMESIYGSQGGHWHHAAMTYDHLMDLRFGPRAADWGPLPQNLYLAGAGAHPGGGVTGVPGMLAAEAMIEDAKS